MTVRDVLEYLASGMSIEDILADFPDLTEEDIRMPGVRDGSGAAVVVGSGRMKPP